MWLCTSVNIPSKHCDKSLFLDIFLSLTEFHVEWIYFLMVMGEMKFCPLIDCVWLWFRQIKTTQLLFVLLIHSSWEKILNGCKEVILQRAYHGKDSVGNIVQEVKLSADASGDFMGHYCVLTEHGKHHKYQILTSTHVSAEGNFTWIFRE